MGDDIFEQLADALDRLPNGFTRTDSGVEIKILKKIFSEQEARLAASLSHRMESVDDIAARIGVTAEEVGKLLFQLVRRGLVWMSRDEGKVQFRLAPFIVGIYESSLDLMDDELARLSEDYLAEGGAVGIMQPQPALHRVVPTQDSVKAEWILPYDDVRALFLSAKSFGVRKCICRVQQDALGTRKCDFPVAICLNFSKLERAPREGDISKEEAFALLDESEKVGLVHTVANVVDGVGYVCNCCGCCCGILRGVTEWGVDHAVAYANYFASIDPQVCSACGTCIERCQVHAVFEGDGFSVVDRQKCIGCGLCVTGCTTGAATLQRRPEAEIIHPPADFATWEQERLRNRGLSD